MTRWWDTLKMMIKMKGTLRYYSGWYMQSLDEAARELHDPWLAHVFKHLSLMGRTDSNTLAVLCRANFSAERAVVYP